MPRPWTCTALAGALLIAATGCQQQADPHKSSTGKAKAGTSGIDAEMQAKIAEAKAEFEKLSPAEKKKLEARFAKEAATLPLSLAEAATLGVRRQGQPPSKLAFMAPRGTPAIIAAWASWCVPCKVEARELARLRKQYRPDQLSIAYLNIGDPKVEAEKGPQFLRDTGAESLGLTMLEPKAFLKLTRVDQVSVPRILVYDRSGRPTEVIVGGIAGDRPDPRIAKAIGKILGSR